MRAPYSDPRQGGRPARTRWGRTLEGLLLPFVALALVVAQPALLGAARATTFSGTSPTTVTVEVGSFTAATAMGAQTVTGLARNYSTGTHAIYFWTGGANGASGTDIADNYACHGFATASEAMSVGIWGKDNSNPTETSRRMSTTKCLTFPNAAGSGVIAEASFTSFGNTQFIINWSTADTRAPVINFVIFGSLASTKVVTQDLGTAAKTGLGFKPDLVLTAQCGLNAAGSGADAYLGFGMFNKALEQGASAIFASDNVAGSNVSRYQRNTKCIIKVGATEASDYALGVSSMDSDGWTLDGTAATQQGIFLALKGCKTKINTVTVSASVQTVTHSAGGTPLGILLATVDAATSATAGTEMSLSIGATDGTRQRSSYTDATDNGGGANNRMFSGWRSDKSIIGVVNPSGAVHYGSIGSIGATTYALTHDLTNSIELLQLCILN